MVLGIVLAAGGSPQGYIGGKYWHDPGAFVHGLKGVAFALSNAAFAFSGTELCGLAASETKTRDEQFRLPLNKCVGALCYFTLFLW